MGAVDRDGMTLIPLKLYFNERGRAKLLLAVAKGKKLHDKRESEKKRDWGREKGACCGRGITYLPHPCVTASPLSPDETAQGRLLIMRFDVLDAERRAMNQRNLLEVDWSKSRRLPTTVRPRILRA